MSEQDIIAATFRALGVESPEPGMSLPVLARRAKRFEARYTGLRAALDSVMGDELHTRLNRLIGLLRAKAFNIAQAIDDGHLASGQEDYARGEESAYLDAATLLAQYITVMFDGVASAAGAMVSAVDPAAEGGAVIDTRVQKVTTTVVWRSMKTPTNWNEVMKVTTIAMHELNAARGRAYDHTPGDDEMWFVPGPDDDEISICYELTKMEDVRG